VGVIGPLAQIDLDAYRRNLSLVSAVVAPAGVMAIVKADAYGHGLMEMTAAAVAAGVRSVGTLDIQTALVLRDSGVGEETLLFAWLLAPAERYAEAIAVGIDLGVSTLAQLEAIAAAAASRVARVHLKIDTGLHRNGASASEWPQLVRRAVELEQAGRIELVGVWTHISEASDAEDTRSIRLFHDAIGAAQALGARFELRHLAASAAGFARADARFDLVRIGAFGYGIAPGGGVTPASLGLRPVMTVSAPVLLDQSLPGEFGSARIGIGFCDGISTGSAGKVSVTIDGVRYPVESVDSDTLLVRTGDARLDAGAEAFLFGDGSRGEQTLQDWADATGTIGEEIVTRLSGRVVRSYVG
jgi:alanine racemase